MSILIHVKKHPKVLNQELDDNISEESLVETSNIKNNKSSVNKPMTVIINSNDLNGIDKSFKSSGIKKKFNTTSEDKDLL